MIPFEDLDTIGVLSIPWTSAADGSVTKTTRSVTGEVVRVSAVHGTGDAAPTNLYDATLLDADGLDVLAGKGANLAVAANVHINPTITDQGSVARPLFISSVLTLAVTNAGNAKSGTFKVYLKK